MPTTVLASAARRILIDPEGAGAPDLQAAVAELRAARPALELLQLGGDAELPGVARLPLGEDAIAMLDAARAEGRLEGALLFSARERLRSWARRGGLAALAPEAGLSLAEQFSAQALVLSDAVAQLLQARRQREGQPFICGINGIDKAGKTLFAERLAERLAALGLQVERVALRDFTAEKKARRPKGYPEPESFYHKQHAMERLREQLLEPVHQCRELPLRLSYDVYDPDRERLVEKRSLELDRDGLILLEGPFLFQVELFSFFHFRIYLVSDFERAIELALEGSQGRRREKRLREFQRRELAAQSLYLRQETPWKRAHLVLRGVNTAAPSVAVNDDDLRRDASQSESME